MPSPESSPSPTAYDSGLTIRRATSADLDFLIDADLTEEGYTFDPAEPAWGEQELAEHRAKIAAFVREPAEAGWVAEDLSTHERVGMLLARFRDRQHEPANEANLYLFRFLPPEIFPPDGRFCEVFNLWVHPAYRRRGLATGLKQEMEHEARRRGMGLIYTHTEAGNPPVVEMNLKLGYRVVRVGPIWDAVVRVSLVKDLGEGMKRTG